MVLTKVTGTLADLAGGVLLSHARVTEVRHHSPRFTTIELESEAFRSATWTPGGKLQIRPERGTLGMRTYTPTRWDRATGTTELIAYVHGDGPAARWFRQVRTGDPCEVFGPRRSLDLGDGSAGTVLVGDETGIGLACALRSRNPEARYVFEASDPTELAGLLAGLDLADRATIVARDPEHTRLIAAAREAATDTPYDLVLSGDAATVHAVRRDVRGWPRAPQRVRAKAYWAQGRTGLD
jgi:NADPH-dependent ferric siderophore reductase